MTFDDNNGDMLIAPKTKKHMRNERKRHDIYRNNMIKKHQKFYDRGREIFLENPRNHCGHKKIEKRGDGWVFCFVEGWLEPYFAYFPSGVYL
jgi:hypothetical protein